MTPDLFPPQPVRFAATRDEALQRLEAFVPLAGRYGRDRNHVLPGHPNVSRLSPAIRHRLILEEEVVAAPLQRYAPSTVEKFTQEVSWRGYWKAWLSLRPQVWAAYRTDLECIRLDPKFADLRSRAARCEAGEGSVAVMNAFARELVETGYLHNHARMWFAGWWIHHERLPWQLGADFFDRHLLDADPASNTLSWRWVAGLQTPGKTYLTRRSNLEKFLSPEFLAAHAAGLEKLEEPKAFLPQTVSRPEITQPSLPGERELAAVGKRTGIWIHEEDLLPEVGPLSELRPVAVTVTGNYSDVAPRLGKEKRAWLISALADAAERAEAHYGIAPKQETERELTESLTDWAEQNALHQVVALRPDVGPLADRMPALRESLNARSIQLVLLDRPSDLALRPYATGGFFSFWKKVQKSGMEPS